MLSSPTTNIYISALWLLAETHPRRERTYKAMIIPNNNNVLIKVPGEEVRGLVIVLRQTFVRLYRQPGDVSKLVKNMVQITY